MSLTVTSGQEDATRRRSLFGVVYLLSGTLKAVSGGAADLPFRWANLTFSGALGEFEHMLTLPSSIQRELAPDLGSPAPIHPVTVPVRNRELVSGDTLVAMLVDGRYSFEGSPADLRVAYLKPGQHPSELAADDFTYVVRAGTLAEPQSIGLDGFVLPLLPKAADRQRTLPASRAYPVSALSGATSGVKFALPDAQLDPRDDGRAVPLVIGTPGEWLPAVRMTGAYGFTTASFPSGATSITVTNEAVSRLSGADTWAEALAGTCFIHRTSTHSVTSAAVSGDAVTLTVPAGLQYDVPQGAVVQAADGGVSGRYLASANYINLFSGEVEAAWELADGRIIPATLSGSGLFWRLGLEGFGSEPYGRVPGYLQARVITDWTQHPEAFWPTEPEVVSGGTAAAVTQQPVHSTTTSTTSKERLTDKANFPSGGSGSGNSAARDGNEDTGVSLPAGTSIALTFNDAPSPFANGDTTGSVLYVVAQGTIQFDSGTGTIFGNIGGVSKGQYRFVQTAARNFNQQVRCVGQGGGGVVYEVWWEHDLERSITLTSDTQRDADVAVTGGGGTPKLPPKLLPARRLVYRVRATRDNAVLSKMDRASTVSGGAATANPYAVTGPGLGGPTPYPSTVFAGLLGYFFDEVSGELNLAGYDAAHSSYVSKGLRLNFALLEDVGWQELEAALALQSRSHAFQSVSGHELVFINSVSGLAALVPARTFRLPGTPTPNVVQSSRGLLERTSFDAVVNTVDVEWHPEFLNPGRFSKRHRAQNAASRAALGERLRPDGPFRFFAHSQPSAPVVYSAGPVVADVADFIAERLALGRVRFQFDTGWSAYGLDRGSIVAVVFPVNSTGALRQVQCEVEDISVSPINSERWSLTCKSVAPPQVVQTDAVITWLDLFTFATDAWVSAFETAGEPWTSELD